MNEFQIYLALFSCETPSNVLYIVCAATKAQPEQIQSDLNTGTDIQSDKDRGRIVTGDMLLH